MADATLMTPPSRWRGFVTALTAWAEAVEMDSFSYLDGRVTTLERRIALLETSVGKEG